jgi:anti-sigma-K factor RskA
VDGTSLGSPSPTSRACEEVRPLLPAAAIGALDRDEAADVARHLLLCRSCRQEFDQLSDTVDYIGLTVPQVNPSPALRQQFLSSLSEDESPIGESRRTVMTHWRWAATAAAALVVVLLTANLIVQFNLFGADHHSSAQPTRTASAATTPLVWYDLVAASSSSKSAHGVLCAQESGNLAWLIVQDLPQPPAGKVYQAWLTGTDGRISAGTFTVDPKGRGFLTIRLTKPIESYSVMGVTDEPNGGSQTPTGERLLSASL